MTVKISANLPDAEMATLKRLAEEQGLNMTDVLRRALKLEEFVHEQHKKGAQIVVRDGNHEREVIRH